MRRKDWNGLRTILILPDLGSSPDKLFQNDTKTRPNSVFAHRQ